MLTHYSQFVEIYDHAICYVSNGHSEPKSICSSIDKTWVHILFMFLLSVTNMMLDIWLTFQMLNKWVKWQPCGLLKLSDFSLKHIYVGLIISLL